MSDISLEDRIKSVKIVNSIDLLYYDKGATIFEDLGKEGSSYTYVDPSVNVHKIVINERFMGKENLIIPSSHHEHGHILFTVTPKDIGKNKTKKYFYNLTEDIRLEAIISAFFPNMKTMFNNLHQELMLVSGKEAGNRIQDMLHMIFGIRLFQHTDINASLASHSDPTIEKITTLLLQSINLYNRDIIKYWKLYDTKEIIENISKSKIASKKYVEAVKLGFKLIDDENANQNSSQQPQTGKAGGNDDDDDDDHSNENKSGEPGESEDSDGEEEETEGSAGDAGDNETVDDDDETDETETGSGGKESSSDGKIDSSKGSNDADQQEKSDQKSCFHGETDIADLDKLSDALSEKLQESMKLFDKTTEDKDTFDVEKHIKTITKYCGSCRTRMRQGSHLTCKVREEVGGYKAVLPRKLSRALADKRKIVAVERSNMRMGSAPLTGHGKKFIDLKRQAAHFEFELCFDVSGSVNGTIMDREYKIGHTLFETFKHMSKIKVSSFSSDYSVITRNANKFPKGFVISNSIVNGRTNLFEALKTATEEYTDKKKVYVFVCITDGEAGIPMYMGVGSSPKIAQIYLKQLQKRNIYVVLIPVITLSSMYVSLYGKYYVKADDVNVDDKFQLQTVVNRFGDLIYELWEEKAR